MLNEAVRERAKRHADDAVARGGRLLAGGRPPKDGVLSGGAFFLPAVVDRVPIEARVMYEKTYGPVAAIHHASGDRELLNVTNSLPYGLAAYVYSSDLERAWAFADRVEAGAVGINVNDVTELRRPSEGGSSAVWAGSWDGRASRHTWSNVTSG